MPPQIIRPTTGPGGTPPLPPAPTAPYGPPPSMAAPPAPYGPPAPQQQSFPQPMQAPFQPHQYAQPYGQPQYAPTQQPAPAPTYGQALPYHQALPPSRTSDKRAHTRIILLIIGIVLTLMVLGGFVIGSLIVRNAGESKTTSDQLVAAVQAKDGIRAYALTGPAFRQSATQDQVVSLVDSAAPLAGGSTVEVVSTYLSSTTQTGNKAVYVYSFEKDGKKLYLRVIMDKPADTWQVYNMRFSETPLEAKLE